MRLQRDFAAEESAQAHLDLTAPGLAAPLNLPDGAYQKILEFALPIKNFTNANQSDFEIVALVQKDGLEQERWPSERTASNSLSQP